MAPLLSRATFAISLLALTPTLVTTAQAETTWTRIPVQFIAALGDPGASSGAGADHWGLWRQDPGPRGVRLSNYENLKAADGLAPAGWRFEPTDWWLEEHGLIMPKPDGPLPPGKYLVTGDRETEAVLTVHAKDQDGAARWDLGSVQPGGIAKLYDVTHLRCRSANYHPAASGAMCTPATVQSSAFPVAPGGVMPAVAGCAKQDYAVLFVIAVGEGE